MDALIFTLQTTFFTCAMTILGSSAVFLFKDNKKPIFTKISLGFAAGIMIAASVWSLIIPAMETVEQTNSSVIVYIAGGFIFGVLFLIVIDKYLPHIHIRSKEQEGPKTTLSKHKLFFIAITIHNIPEGMAIGVACLSAISIGTSEAISAAWAFAIGMGIQNIPEGSAVSLPLLSNNYSKIKAFLFGCISAIVEPIAAIVIILLSSWAESLLPFLLTFAAGAMLYVVVEELIPEAKLGEHSDLGTISVLSGFLIMMLLDTCLG